MINFFKKNNQFHLIFIIFSIFFSIILFLSAPTLFDYKKMHQKINKEIESEFNINIVKKKDFTLCKKKDHIFYFQRHYFLNSVYCQVSHLKPVFFV